MAESFQASIDSISPDDNWGVNAAELLLQRARALSCSDLHIQCRSDSLVARGRREGQLFRLAVMPGQYRELLVARFKVLAKLPAFIRGEPQDGRLELPSSNSNPVHARVSFLPTIHGESVVVRFPESHQKPFKLDNIGLPDPVRVDLELLLNRQEGTVIVTGPSSSGKTTTLYAMLDYINSTRGDSANIVTIEDPVERELPFASQVQVNPPQNMTFDRALRAALRQDPNVLMIGEIRDLETARVATQAGMTGHLVLSTLHAGRAAYVFTRLLSLGLEPYLVASALTGSLAQRLARCLCPACRGKQAGDEVCVACSGSGYSDRVALFELVRVTEELRTLILARSSASEILAYAQGSQANNLEQQANQLEAQGRISQAERIFLLPDEVS